MGVIKKNLEHFNGYAIKINTKLSCVAKQVDNIPQCANLTKPHFL